MRTDEILLPCGCKIWNEFENGVPAFKIQACALGLECKYVKYAMEETARQGKPTKVRKQ